VGYSLVLEPRRLDVSRRVIHLRDLPPSLDGLRAVQLSDVHHGPWFSLARVRELVETANDLRPDLVLLTGDYVLSSPVYIEPVAAELARLRPRIATVAVLGNHDWYQSAAMTRDEFARWGIPVIDNDRRVLTPERRLVAEAEAGLALCGVGDLLKDRPDYRRALAGLPGDMPRVLLSHNPDVAEEPELTGSGLRVDLIVSGHTHGGQIKLPFVGAPVSGSWYGEKYREGLVQGPVCPVFICRGIGVVGLPLRVGVTPEMAVLEFRVASLNA
jgi:predicted MPP superfamily phosphohydrolase